ncbi:MAG: saccharopine dehydrogenase family protein [Candidatus Heimdallarchaeota archaeon]
MVIQTDRRNTKMVKANGRVFAILGAGRQGTAAAYDLVKFGKAEKVKIGDLNLIAAIQASSKVNDLLDTDIVKPVQINVDDKAKLSEFLSGVNTVVSAVPYYYNLGIAEVAIATRTNMCDLGGNTDLVKKELELDPQAKEAEISIIPDCGQVPGMGTSLCVYAMSLLDTPEEVFMWDGGLPQNPRPPFNYSLTFHVDGLINEYYGTTEFLRNGEIIEVPCFLELEEIEFPSPLGKLEAFTTAGGTSTAPRTFEGKLKTYQNKTVRYPGHYSQLKTMHDLGLFSPHKINLGDTSVSPRKLLAALLEPLVTFTDDKDVVVIRVICCGLKEGRKAKAQIDLIDFYDETTGFTAMQRTTGWDAAIVAIMMAEGRTKKGAVPLELALDSADFVSEMRRRGLHLSGQVSFID